jgi:hypothetical protein
MGRSSALVVEGYKTGQAPLAQGCQDNARVAIVYDAVDCGMFSSGPAAEKLPLRARRAIGRSAKKAVTHSDDGYLKAILAN